MANKAFLWPVDLPYTFASAAMIKSMAYDRCYYGYRLPVSLKKTKEKVIFNFSS